ncbi:CHAT domain-containing protein [Streptomyces sp. NPDC093591]|uniref:CHAT domain-containing protein n=1 Tax=Streptomyces sp. NPDC093591 TaxID=3366044 RepID=UPI00380A5658
MAEREELLAAMWARIDGVTATGDLSAVLERGSQVEALHLIDRFTKAGNEGEFDLEVACALGWWYHVRSLVLPAQQAEHAREMAVVFLQGCFVAGMDRLPQPLLASIAESVYPHACDVLWRAYYAPILNASDLSELVTLWRRIVRAAPLGHPKRADWLAQLGTALEVRFRGTGELTDLDDSVEAQRAAVRATPQGHPDHSKHLALLANSLQLRFASTSHEQLADLDEAVEAYRAAVDASPGDASHLSALADALADRFQHTGRQADLNEALELHSSTIRTSPDSDPVRTATHMASGFRNLFRQTGNLENLNHAVEACRLAVRAAKDDPGLPLRLDALGEVLRERFTHTERMEDLDEAVEASRNAVRASPKGGHDYAGRLLVLGNTLRSRFTSTWESRDLQEALEAYRAALRVTPHDSPNHAMLLTELGDALSSGWVPEGDVQYVHEALSVWGDAVEAPTTLPLHRFRAACSSMFWTACIPDLGRAANFAERAVLMLPELAPRRLKRNDQQRALGSHGTTVTADAVALALAAPGGTAQERAVRALRLAEAGRSVLLSQALDTRSDLTDLHQEHPDLAQRFATLRELLDQDSAVTLSALGVGHAQIPVGGQRPQLVAELEALLGRIRSQEGFADFGLPPTSDDLLAEAALGPVVTFNVSGYRSDALLLTRAGISSVSLPKLTPDNVIERVNAFYQALDTSTAPDGDRIAAQKTLREILEWLWEHAAEPVLSALADLGEAVFPAKDGEPLQRVWLAPGGLLGLLPLHAAGFHTDPGDGPQRRTVLDRVISSYTPTIRALHHARTRRPRPTDQPQSLIVAMPTTPGHNPLRYVSEEVRRIRGLFHDPIQLIEVAQASDGTHHPRGMGAPSTATVLARLPECAIAHFACHGVSDRVDPSRSQLLLHDHATTPLTVSALAQVNLDHAQLAYLSACSTADPGNPKLLDESIHLTSAFQLAGFPHVVGTLWPINDRLAVEVAESFYTHLTTGPPGTLDPTQAATALHHTIRGLRDRYPATPSLWAAFLHSGA